MSSGPSGHVGQPFPGPPQNLSRDWVGEGYGGGFARDRPLAQNGTTRSGNAGDPRFRSVFSTRRTSS